jgi:hypothetical protein
MIRGSCLCGGVRYEITGALRGALNCHCSMCRKAHGAAFRSRASVRASDFRWTQGAELVTFYESSPGTHRGFCRVCGSPLLSASISSRRFTDCRLVRWTTTPASSRCGTFSSRTKPHGMTSRMSYRSFRSFRQKLPDSAIYSTVLEHAR